MKNNENKNDRKFDKWSSTISITKLITECRNSSFAKPSHTVNIDLETFIKSMTLYTHSFADVLQREKMTSEEFLTFVTPEFQRSNDKWSKKMKVSFIENLLKGAKTNLLLFKMEDEDDSKILDGLQRTTAILDFIDGKIKPFGFTFSELNKDNQLRKFRVKLTISIYRFNALSEVGSFYIEMNENITHSKKDIQKAKDWFLDKSNTIEI